jgi:porin
MLLPRRFLTFILVACAGMAAFADPTAPVNPSTPAAPNTPPSSPTNGAASFWTQDKLTADWFGLRPELQNDSLTIGLDSVTQGVANFSGGIHQGTVIADTLDLKVSCAIFTSGTFYLDLQDHAGPDPSQNLVGDIQRFSNFNFTPFFHVAELWYQQSLLNNTWRFKIGKFDANDEFYVVDNGANFLNSSSQISPTLVDFPTYPFTMLGASLFYTPNDSYYASFGIFDNTRHDKFLVFTGADQYNQFPPGGVYLIGETGFKWTNIGNWQADGNIRLGAWGETGDLPRLNGGNTQGTYGFYTIVNQTLWKPDWKPEETRGLRMFLEYAESPGDLSLFDRHLGAGFTWTGLSPDRPNDLIGAGPEYVNLSNKAGLPKSFELAAEAFYQFQLAPWASIQPDLQYICHPGGIYSNALVGTLQITVHF